jgi:phosphate transport system ATP-binding protein
VFRLDDVHVSYGKFLALRGVNLEIGRNEITAFIGPSGCGKSTLIRCLNRMNDLIPGRGRGQDPLPRPGPVRPRRRPGRGPPAHRHGVPEAQPVPQVDLRQRRLRPKVIGMRPRAWTSWSSGRSRAAASGTRSRTSSSRTRLSLSGGQQQRLCIARAIAVEPDVILMDEPCSALDPVSTGRIEDLMERAQADYTIVIVTHNMQQAARISDRTAFFTAEAAEGTGDRTGLLVEYDRTDTSSPSRPTEDRGLRHRSRLRLGPAVYALRAPQRWEDAEAADLSPRGVVLRPVRRGRGQPRRRRPAPAGHGRGLRRPGDEGQAAGRGRARGRPAHPTPSTRGSTRPSSPPFDREDIHALAGQLDDVLDAIEAAADMLVLHKVAEPLDGGGRAGPADRPGGQGDRDGLRNLRGLKQEPLRTT